MEAKELMIGDWVVADYMIGKQVKAKVGRLSPRVGEEAHDQIGFIPVPIINNLEQYINDERSIHPIPLTDEILEANGFELHSFSGIMMWERPEFVISKFMNDSVGKNNFTYHYVHQLQHALRLCGLTELANNFVVV